MAIAFENVVGKKIDWADVVTNVQMVDTPFTAWVPMLKDIVAVEKLYQAEVYRKQITNSHPDGLPVTSSQSAGTNRRQLRSLIQYMTKMADTSKLTQELGNNAAIADELAHEIGIQTKELSRDLEASALSPQECRIGITGNVGYLFRGAPNWIQNTPQTVYPVDPLLYPASGQIDTTATASLCEDTIINIMEATYLTTRSKNTTTAFVAPNLQRAFNNFPVFVPASPALSGGTVNAGAYPSAVRGGAFDRGIQRYLTPFGDLDLVLSANNYVLGGTGTLLTHSGLFLHQDKWALGWASKPKWVNKPYAGGHYESFCEALPMLVCWNPQGESKYAPAT